MSNNWSENLRKRMETHEEPSPKGLWDDIEQILKQEGSIKTYPKRYKYLLWGKRIGAVAAVILIMLFIADYLMIENSHQLQVITQNKQSSNEHIKNISTDHNVINKVVTSNTDNKIFAQAKKDISTLVTKESLYTKDNSSLIAKIEDKIESERENSQSESKIEKTESNKSKNSSTLNKDNNIGGDQNIYLPINKQRSRYTKWKTGIYASNIPSNSAKKNEGYGSFISEETPFNEGEPVCGENPQNDILIQNKYREVYTNIKHRQPIMIGVSVNYSFDNRWSLTSGLTYSILSSHLRSGSDSYYYTSEQTLRNIGIPLNINYNMAKSKRAYVYLSLGGLVEKNVSGKLTTEYIIENQTKTNQKEKISVDQLQWSANTSVGVQYNLSQKIGLYAEPSINYYFKNGSDVETIYKEKPLNLSLRFGLRLSLNQ